MTYGEVCELLKQKIGGYWVIGTVDLNDGNGTKEVGFYHSSTPFPSINVKTYRQGEALELLKQYGIDPFDDKNK